MQAKVEAMSLLDSVPLGIRWRSSTWFIAVTVFLSILTDIACYGLVVPIIPFRLQAIGFTGNIGSEVGILVMAYAAGLIISSPFVAVLGELCSNRRTPLLGSLAFMAAATVLFMETSSYPAMIAARVLQGVSGTGVWTLGLALVFDSVPEERIGTVLGYVLIGMSAGAALGPTMGGVLYARAGGWRAPFVFALILILLDFVLRVLIIEKHIALKYVEAGYIIPGFEAPGYTSPEKRMASLEKEEERSIDSPSASPPSPSSSDETFVSVTPSIDAPATVRKTIPWRALSKLFTNPRPVTLLAATFLNGIALGGILDTGMTLWLNQQYGIDPLGAGLVFLGVVVPSIFVSPVAGWICDRHPNGTKYIIVLGVTIGVPVFCLLLISPIPLPLFVFFLVLVGVSTTLFVTPVAADLSDVAATSPEIGPAHVFGLFNMFYSIGSLIGPIIAGELISVLGITRGWQGICGITSVLSASLIIPAFLYAGGARKRINNSDSKLEVRQEKSQISQDNTSPKLEVGQEKKSLILKEV